MMTSSAGPSRALASSSHARRDPRMALACAHALLEESPPHRVARERERGLEMIATDIAPAAAKLELAERREIEGIPGKAIATCDGADLLESTLGTLVLRDGDGAVEPDDRRGTNRHQRVVQGDYLPPIRVLGATRVRVDRCDCCFDVILGQFRTGR